MTAATTERVQPFPPPLSCPSWCEGKHGLLGPDEWESQDGGETPTTVYRIHGVVIGTVGDPREKAGVSIVAEETAERGGSPAVSEPRLDVWTADLADFDVAEALELSRLLLRAAYRLTEINDGPAPDLDQLGVVGTVYWLGYKDGRAGR